MNKKLNYWLAVSASLVMATSPAIFSSCSDDDPKKEQGSNEGENGGNGENNGGNNNNQGGGTDDPTNAVDATTTGFNYFILNDEEVSITAITVGSMKMVIPAYVKIDGKTYKVTKLADGLFDDCVEGATVMIPTTLKDFSYGTFSGMNVEFATNPIKDSGTKDGYGYVDLGLSVKWASCNVGAKTPEEYGDYFRWGEVTPYTENSAKYDYADLGSVLSASNDAATVNMGSAWRMPTAEEMDELMEKCNTAFAKYNGVNGLFCFSKVNSKAIFIPAAGLRRGSVLYNVGSLGLYWSSSLSESYSDLACHLYFDSSYVDRSSSNRYLGYSVRAVSE